MPKLMQAMDGHLRTARDRVDTVAGRTACETLTASAYQQHTLAAESILQLFAESGWVYVRERRLALCPCRRAAGTSAAQA